MTQTMQSEDPRYWEDYQIGVKYPLGSTSFTAVGVAINDFALLGGVQTGQQAVGSRQRPVPGRSRSGTMPVA